MHSVATPPPPVGEQAPGSPSRAAPRRTTGALLGLLVALAGLVATVAVALAWRANALDDARDARAADVASSERNVDEALEEVEALVLAVGAAAGATEDLTAQTFTGPVLAAAEPDQPAVASVAVVEPVADDDLEAFVEARRRAGLDGYQVRNPVDDADEHLVATFEQSGGSQPVLGGLDLAGLAAVERQLVVAAESGGAPAGPALGRLPSSDTSLVRSGFLVAAAVTEAGGAGQPGGTLDEVRLWMVALVDGERLLDESSTGPDLELELRAGDELVASTASEGGAAPSLVELDGAAPVEVGSTGPLVVVVADPGGLEAGAATREATLILVAGGVASVLLGALVWALARTRAGALALAADATQHLARSEEQFRAVVQNLSDVVLVTDADARVRYASPSVRTLLGREPEHVAGRDLFAELHPDDEPVVRRAMGAGRDGPLVELRLRHADGSWRHFEGTVADLLDDPDVGGYVCTAHDVSHRKATEQRLAHDATHDALTNLPNRALLEDRLGHALDRSARTGGAVAVLFVDLDGFKEVNDTAGHATGDRVLAEVGARVATTARASDTVARFGGDEFVVVCEDLSSAEDAEVVARRVLEVIAAPVLVGLDEYRVGASIGIVLAEPAERDVGLLLRRADSAMYEAKQGGRGRIAFYGAAPA